MEKWQITLIIMLLFIPIAIALEDCKGIMPPGDLPCLVISSYQYETSCSSNNVNIYSDNGSLIREKTMGDWGASSRCNITFGDADNETALGSYLFNFSSGESAKIIIESEDEMASLSVMLFVGGITAALFFIGLKINLSKNPLANLILKRCAILLGLLLLSLDTAMLATIADNAGLGISREIFRYLWLVNWTIYLWMLWLFWTTLTGSLKLWQELGKNKRMGLNYENEFDD